MSEIHNRRQAFFLLFRCRLLELVFGLIPDSRSLLWCRQRGNHGQDGVKLSRCRGREIQTCYISYIETQLGFEALTRNFGTDLKKILKSRKPTEVKVDRTNVPLYLVNIGLSNERNEGL